MKRSCGCRVHEQSVGEAAPFEQRGVRAVKMATPSQLI
jgi:hypothetical protein